MAKNTPTYDDEIDLIELIQVVIAHKAKYIILGLVGLVLGLIYTFEHQPRILTSFKVQLGHPAFDNNFLINSIGVQDLLNRSELDKSLTLSLNFNQRKMVFDVVTDTDEVHVSVNQLFTDALNQELSTLKLVANSFKGLNDKPHLIINNNNNNNNNNIYNSLTWTNQDIAKLDSGEVLQSLKFSFGQPKVLYPNPKKHGLIGAFIGFVLGFAWMITHILLTHMRERH